MVICFMMKIDAPNGVLKFRRYLEEKIWQDSQILTDQDYLEYQRLAADGQLDIDFIEKLIVLKLLTARNVQF